MSNTEQTLSIIKPDAVERNLENKIKSFFKILTFFWRIIFPESNFEFTICTVHPEYLSSGPIVVMVLEKENAVLGNRELMGATNPKEAEEGTIRKKYGISIDKNSVHGSDSVENAKIEIDFFFKD